jgi:threonyl-tRNA synthetase
MMNGRNDKGNYLDRLRHSTAHVMAEAVLEMFPDAKIAIGPAIEDGFYYDFLLPRTLTPDDLGQIEEGMKRIIEGKFPFQREEVSREEALKLFKDQDFKVELITEMPEGEVISTYTQDDFTDLCRGPHVQNTGEIPEDAFKLMSIAGAYWRGDEHRAMLQRIYGTVWPDKAELDEYLHRLEEIQRRDHRKLGRELDLFSTHEEGGPGLIYWHPKGAVIREMIENFWRKEHRKRGYDIVYSPHIAKVDLWKTSGHWGFYRDSMYSPMDIDGAEYLLKPMNCPFAILMFKTQIRSYRDLPMRWAELGTVYRYERAGVLHGLLRVRGFTQDDAHIFCRPDQLLEEITGVIDLALFMLKAFGYKDYDIELSVRDPNNKAKYIGGDAQWELAEGALREALEKAQLPYKPMEGEAKFYGPAIDIKTKDALGRGWQGTTIQVDFNMPERFDVTYVGEDGADHRVVMVHRTILGSMERFVATLVEHYAGAFPVWLSPLQAMVIPIADRHLEYAQSVVDKLRDAELRVGINSSSERMNNKIRQAQVEKIPYMLVIGDREVENGTVSVRLRTEENLGAMPVDDFLEKALKAVREKSEI